VRELRVAFPPGRGGFDLEQPGGNSEFHRLVYGRLFVYPPRLDPLTGQLVADLSQLDGQLASGWEVSADGQCYRVRLREGIRSPFGHELTAEDVRWSWERAFALRDVGKWVALIGSVPGPEAVVVRDRLTIEFRLRAPNPTFLHQLTRSTPTIFDATEAQRHATASDPWAAGWLARQPAGFGPYRLEAADSWGETVFCAYPSGMAPPAIERIRFLAVPGRVRRLVMLREGAVDLVPGLEARDLPLLADAPGVRTVVARSGSHVALILNCRQPPFDSPLVRRAVAAAVPYSRILAEVYRGTAAAWRSPLPWPTPGATEEFWRQEAAPALLAQAGLADGFSSELFFDAANEEHRAIARLVAEALAEVNIRLTLEPLDPATFWYGGRYVRAFPLLLWEDWHQVPDPYYALVHDYHSSKLGLINCGNYHNSQLDALIAQIEREPRPAARAALVREAQRLILADCPSALIAQPAAIAALREGVEGFFFPPDRALRYDLLRLN
jgi:peptide/nickel transport system substrate-binding protein